MSRNYVGMNCFMENTPEMVTERIESILGVSPKRKPIPRSIEARILGWPQAAPKPARVQP
jgi:hypothetical protein